MSGDPRAMGPVLVTGGAGFIGSHLVEALVARRVAVTVADDLSWGRREDLGELSERIEIVPIDLCRGDLDSLLSGRGFTHIFHLAGHANVAESVRAPRMDFERNGVATFELLEAVRRASPRSAFLQASSAAVYGHGSGGPMREGDVTEPVSPYGASKLAAERYVSIYANLYGLKTAILRLFPAYGPRQRQQVIYDFLVKLRADGSALAVQGDGSPQRDFVYVADVVEAFLTVAERGPMSGEAYNVSGGEPLSIRELARKVASAMALSPRFTFDSEPRAGDARHWIADTSRIRALGFKPRVSFDDGLARTVAWFRTLSTS
ncbi:MAG: GDP-mannose 4,6-dehydratase [Acidobacteriota bacterium]|nr:GDP-mannose 4,6-dehydratase [Acidobacteriota bacterium]